MKSLVSNPLVWRLPTLLSLGTEHVHELALRASGSLTALRLLLGRCLLALHESKGYKQFGCSSSVHYAAQILGVSTREARECRRVARELQPLAELSLAAEQGTISWSQLREVTRKAVPDTEAYWLALCQKFNAEQIQVLVRKTPWGSLPGEAFEAEESATTELRCPMSPRVFQMLAQARRLYSIEQEQAVSNAEIVEMALAAYVAGRPADAEALEKARDEADKDLQAEEARRIPLVHQAREVAQELGLLGEAASEQHSEEPQPSDSDLLAQALGAPTQEEQVAISTDYHEDTSLRVEGAALSGQSAPVPKRPTWVVADTVTQAKPTENHQPAQASWTNPRLRYNPQSRLASKAQRKELLRRDCWKCSTPGCSSKIWLHLHHLKSYAEGGETTAQNLCSVCSGCHRNIHTGALQIQQHSDGTLLFLDGEGRRLDRRSNLEVAGWGLEDSERLRLATGGMAGKAKERSTLTAPRRSKDSGKSPCESGGATPRPRSRPCGQRRIVVPSHERTRTKPAIEVFRW